ncbi:MAG: Na+/H+ antiporter NhaA [Chloroflexi bacterium]|nr:Na+/H+ antiporter NhaA [Chloroflexota bacterium]
MAVDEPPAEGQPPESPAGARPDIVLPLEALGDALIDPRQAMRQAQLRRFARPAERFIRTEVAGGIVIIIAVVVALVWANSPWSDSYLDLLDVHLALDVGLWEFNEPLHLWINDAAMVLFFFLVGMEIKREAVIGELSSPRKLVVPMVGAAGGMVVPVLIFLLIVDGADARSGWAIPMATDIAIALGVVTLLGSRVPSGLKVLLLGVAVVDDIGGVLVIAVFYTESLDFGALLLAGGVLVTLALFNRYGVRAIYIYVALGAVGWAATVQSGVHPTIFGVILGLMTPWRPWFHPAGFLGVAEKLLQRFRLGHEAPEKHFGREHEVEALRSLATLSTETVAPLDRLEHSLLPWSAFIVVPVFAFANAGVDLRGGALEAALSSSLGLGVGLGLVLGKPIGVTLGIWLSVRMGATLPTGVTWPQVVAMGMVAGIGFTVALFITELSYPIDVLGAGVAEDLLREAKVGILLGSLLAALVGGLVLWADLRAEGR